MGFFVFADEVIEPTTSKRIQISGIKMNNEYFSNAF